MKAGSAATRIPATGSSGSGGTARGTKDTDIPGTSSACASGHRPNRGETGPHDGPLLGAPSVRSIARPVHLPTSDGQAQRAEHHGNSDDRQSQAKERPGVDHAVDADGGQEETDPGGSYRERCVRRPIRFRLPYPLASIEVANSNERSSAPSKTGTAMPRSPRRPLVGMPRRRLALPHGRDRLYQLWGERQGHGDCDPGLVQHRRETTEESVRADK